MRVRKAAHSHGNRLKRWSLKPISVYQLLIYHKAVILPATAYYNQKYTNDQKDILDFGNIGLTKQSQQKDPLSSFYYSVQPKHNVFINEFAQLFLTWIYCHPKLIMAEILGVWNSWKLKKMQASGPWVGIGLSNYYFQCQELTLMLNFSANTEVIKVFWMKSNQLLSLHVNWLISRTHKQSPSSHEDHVKNTRLDFELK